MEKEKALELVGRHFDVPAFLADVLDEILEPALDEVVKKSENPFDDVAKAALYPALAPVLKDLAKRKWEEVVSPE